MGAGVSTPERHAADHKSNATLAGNPVRVPAGKTHRFAAQVKPGASCQQINCSEPESLFSESLGGCEVTLEPFPSTASSPTPVVVNLCRHNCGILELINWYNDALIRCRRMYSISSKQTWRQGASAVMERIWKNRAAMVSVLQSA